MDQTSNSNRLMQQLDQIGEVSNSDIQIQIADADKHTPKKSRASDSYKSYDLQDPDSFRA